MAQVCSISKMVERLKENGKRAYWMAMIALGTILIINSLLKENGDIPNSGQGLFAKEDIPADVSVI
eukprot:gene15756-18723_t